MIGSNEWVEEHERALSTKGVAYINVDISVAGNYTLVLQATPMYDTSITEVIKKVKDPHLNDEGKLMTVYERIAEILGITDGTSIIPFWRLRGESDHASFYQFVGKSGSGFLLN